jgi:hypothetical protein
MTSIRPSGPEAIPLPSSAASIGQGLATAPSLGAQAVSAGLCEGFPDGPLSELLRYPDDRQRSQQQVLEALEDEAVALDLHDRAALGRAVNRLIEATRRYAKYMYQKTLALLEASTSEAPDVMHEVFGERSWRDSLDAALAPLTGINLSPENVTEFIKAIDGATRGVEAAQQALTSQP